MKFYCMYCGEKLTEEDNYCPDCGRNTYSSKKQMEKILLEEEGKPISKKCPDCKTDCFVNDPICSNCGYEFNKAKEIKPKEKTVVVHKYIKKEPNYATLVGSAFVGAALSGLCLLFLLKKRK